MILFRQMFGSSGEIRRKWFKGLSMRCWKDLKRCELVPLNGARGPNRIGMSPERKGKSWGGGEGSLQIQRFLLQLHCLKSTPEIQLFNPSFPFLDSQGSTMKWKEHMQSLWTLDRHDFDQIILLPSLWEYVMDIAFYSPTSTSSSPRKTQ